MEAQKVTVTITIEALSIDAVGALAVRACEAIREEFEGGRLQADDGDVVTWETKRENVTF